MSGDDPRVGDPPGLAGCADPVGAPGSPHTHGGHPPPALGMAGGSELAEQMAQVVHELRSPLAATLQAVDLLGRRPDERPDPELLTIARRQLEAGMRRVDQLLVLLREDADRDPLVLRPQSLRALVEELLEPRLRPDGDPAVVPDLDPGHRVVVDRSAFAHVLDNLVANAARHAPPTAAVRITAEAHGEEIRLMVTDLGPGIDPVLLPTVFDPFVRGRGGGAGLGLTIVRHFAEVQGGRVWIEPVEPQGTRAVVALPRA